MNSDLSKVLVALGEINGKIDLLEQKQDARLKYLEKRREELDTSVRKGVWVVLGTIFTTLTGLVFGKWF